MIERVPRRPLPPFLRDGLIMGFVYAIAIAFALGLVIGHAL